jgi:hypothetical protein
MSRGERYWALIERNWRCQPYDPPPVPWLMENEFIASYPLPGQKERAEGGDRNRQTLCPGNGVRGRSGCTPAEPYPPMNEAILTRP